MLRLSCIFGLSSRILYHRKDPAMFSLCATGIDLAGAAALCLVDEDLQKTLSECRFS